MTKKQSEVVGGTMPERGEEKTEKGGGVKRKEAMNRDWV